MQIIEYFKIRNIQHRPLSYLWFIVYMNLSLYEELLILIDWSSVSTQTRYRKLRNFFIQITKHIHTTKLLGYNIPLGKFSFTLSHIYHLHGNNDLGDHNFQNLNCIIQLSTQSSSALCFLVNYIWRNNSWWHDKGRSQQPVSLGPTDL